jgi:hypothetical protein
MTHHLPWNVKNSSLLVRLWKHRGVKITGDGDGRIADASEPTADGTGRERPSDQISVESVGVINRTEIPENTDPERNRIPDIHARRGIARMIYNLIHLPRKIITTIRRPISPEERERLLDEKSRRAFLLSKLGDMGRMGRGVIGRLTRLKFMNVEAANGKRRVHRVRVDMFAVDYPKGSEYKMKVKTETLPQGVQLTDIVKTETLDECLPLTQMPLHGELGIHGTIITGYPAGKAGIPEIITCLDAWNNLPASAGPYTINMGISQGGIWKKVDLTEAPHLLIAGSSGQGKSNIENYIVCSLLRKGLPRHMINLCLFDLKDGMEFQAYEKIPYFPENAALNHVIYSSEEVPDAIRQLEWEMHSRAEFLKEKKYRSIRDYNLSVNGSRRMPVIFAIFDEFATPVTMLGQQFIDPMIRISNMSRAVGIHLIFATQHPKATIIDTLISINFQMRLAFKMTGPASQTVLSAWDAERLACKGRAVLQHEGDNTELQTPLITDSIIEETVNYSVTGEKQRKASMVDDQSLLDAGLDKFDGNLEVAKLYEYFKGRKVSWNKIQRMLVKMDNQIVEVNGNRYKIIPPRGRVPRRMQPVDNSQMSDVSP